MDDNSGLSLNEHGGEAEDPLENLRDQADGGQI
jgi:hypothetical protein